MFESNNNDDTSKNGVNNILQRNVSSGGMSENEAMLPSLRFDVSLLGINFILLCWF